MEFKQKISEATGIPAADIPASYQVIGDVMLLKFSCSEVEKKKIAGCILEAYPYVKTVCEMKGVEGELREPSVSKIAGNGTETVHKESGIFYKLDVSRIMFSKGNHFERQRLIKQANKNETVVDMFAGIGYFSLPLAKHVKKVYAVEKNPLSFHYLQENMKLNKISNIEAINEDCRKINLECVADRIMMGYFPNTEQFLPFALKILKKKGIIHFHNTYMENDLWKKPEEDLKALGNFKIVFKKKVKSVSPRCYHVVMDVHVRK